MFLDRASLVNHHEAFTCFTQRKCGSHQSVGLYELEESHGQISQRGQSASAQAGLSCPPLLASRKVMGLLIKIFGVPSTMV